VNNTTVLQTGANSTVSGTHISITSSTESVSESISITGSTESVSLTDSTESISITGSTESVSLTDSGDRDDGVSTTAVHAPQSLIPEKEKERKFATPAQDGLHKEISNLKSRMEQLDSTISTLAKLDGTDTAIMTLRNDFKKCENELLDCVKKLKRCQVTIIIN